MVQLYAVNPMILERRGLTDRRGRKALRIQRKQKQ
jgi:hypothetical protein